MNMFRMMRIAAGVDKLRADRKTFRKGYSLAELILGAAVIAAFLVRIYQAYAATSAADKFQDFTSEVGLINGTVHQDFINTSSFDGLTASSIVGSLPRKYADGTGAGVNSVYQTPVTITSVENNSGTGGSDGAGANAAFAVETAIPQGDCVKALLGDMGRNLDAIDVAAAGTKTPTTNVPFNGTDASNACTNATAAADGTVPVTYYFH